MIIINTLNLCIYCIVHRMMMMLMFVNVLICLIILTSQCVCVHSKVININSNNGNDSTECCVNGTYACSSLYTALLNITNNTTIKITSKSVALHNTTTMGSGKLTNITITGSNVTIMCNNSGSVYCESCDHVRIEGITWDSCGDPNGTNIAGVTFNGTSNISLVNCTFQHSQLPAVCLLEVSDNILIQGCNFLSNIPLKIVDHFGILSIENNLPSNSNVTVTIYGSYFYSNRHPYTTFNLPYVFPAHIKIVNNSVVNCNISLNKTTFASNNNSFCLNIDVAKSQLTEILVFNTSYFASIDSGCGPFGLFSSNSKSAALSIMSSNFSGNYGGDMICSIAGNEVSVMINNSAFNDKEYAIDAAVGIYLKGKVSKVMLNNVQFGNKLVASRFRKENGAVSISTDSAQVAIFIYNATFTSNEYSFNDGGGLYIFGSSGVEHDVVIERCKFVNNKSPGHGAALYIDTMNFNHSHIKIVDTIFDHNMAGSSIVYITQELTVINSTFTNNIATSLYLLKCRLTWSGKLLFKNNTAENGGAMYLSQESSVSLDKKANVQFIANTATLNGGAIYVDLLSSSFCCSTDTFGYHIPLNSSVMFINNSAAIAGNSLYFNIPRFCSVNSNIKQSDSILYVPCQFNYSQPVNGKMMHIPCDLDYTSLNGTGAPIVTSPNELRLYFPFNDGYDISSTSKHKHKLHNVYFVRNSIGQVTFTGAVFDYFGRPAQPVTFSVQLLYFNGSECFTYSGKNTNYFRYLLVDNLTNLFVSFSGKRFDTKSINVTVVLTSLLYSYVATKINATLIVEVIPCFEHPGYTYNEDSQTCVCYHANVKCNAFVNEIKRGYWFGSISRKATTSLCPNNYCKFTDRKQISKRYFELPNTIDAQCNHHRVGRACGECSSEYTLSYDSTDCISTNQCGPGWTVLVIVLTCLYWVVIVVGLFGLMYFKFQISLGYLYGIIYYYSTIGILLENNPYIFDSTFKCVSILSSFAQLSPQFLGTLCFVKGLSGIDQLFIHYSHAVAVSLLLLLIVVAARCSTRITLFVSRCIIRVICLIILLCYTSISSTSLQLLQPLIFTDVKEWYTYSSPHIQYFHGRHAVYGVVAIVCELLVGIGFPLLLLLEPFLRRKINFIRIKPLLDQFQGCYKDKYHWFAAYYLICRQVIFLIVYTFNSYYYNMLFYLQIALIVIAITHILIQPYQDQLLNALDTVILFLMVLLSDVDSFPFLEDVAKDIIALVKVIFPLILFSVISMKNQIKFCIKKKHHMPINPDNNGRIVTEENIR